MLPAFGVATTHVEAHVSAAGDKSVHTAVV
jgi:hypothetical protein